MARRSEAKIIEKVQARRPELLDLVSRLIRADSQNPPGDTTNVASIIHDYLSQSGLNPKRHEPIGGHVSIQANLGGGEDGLVLCGHLDTVPVGDRTRWEDDPLSGKITAGKVLGRGAADMKGGVAAIAVAVATLAGAENLDGNVSIALFCDEETGGEYGARLAVRNNLIKGSAMIIGEPTNLRRSGHVMVAAERGALWSRVAYRGSAGHGSLPMLGSNAITEAARRLANIESPILHRVRTPHAARRLVSSGRRVLRLEHADNPRNRPHYALDHYTVNVGTIHGGAKTNVVAESCVVEMDLRIPLGGSTEEAKRIVENLVGTLSLEYFNEAPPSFTPPNNWLVRLAKRTAQRVFGEATPVICAPYTSDGHVFRTKLNIPVVSFGPGYQDKIHDFNEFVYVDDILGCAQVYALAALFCSARDAPLG